MKIYQNLITLVLIISSFSTFARKPAVEDFVGIEHKEYQATPKETEVLFNFNNSMQNAASQNTASSVFTMFFLFAFISLPFLMWRGLTHAKKKDNHNPSVVKITHYENNIKSTKEHSNVEYLSDYKESNKKAS